MPVIGGARIQSGTGTVTFPAPTPNSAPLEGFAIQTPVQGIDLFESVSEVANNVTLFLRSILPGPGISLTTQNGILYLSILESSLPPGPLGPTGATGPTGPTYYDFAGYWRGVLPSDSAPIHYLQVVRSFSLSIGLPGSIASCLNAPTGSVSMPLKRNGSAVGSINFAPATRTGTFTFPSFVSFSAGDIWEVDPPSPQDGSFAGVSWTIVATVP